MCQPTLLIAGDRDAVLGLWEEEVEAMESTVPNLTKQVTLPGVYPLETAGTSSCGKRPIDRISVPPKRHRNDRVPVLSLKFLKTSSPIM
jgi:hypothetical protein